MTPDAHVLVTGAAGHLGANLVRRLLSENVSVRVLVEPGANNRGVENLDVETVEGDIRNAEQTIQAVDGCTHVFHCAAMISIVEGAAAHKKRIFDTNVIGTRNVVQAALKCGVKKVVATGSLSAVGPNPGGTCRESMPFFPFDKPLPYSVTKSLAEYECLKAAAEGLDVVTAISCAILGPNDFLPSRLGRTFIALANRKLPSYIDGGFEFVAARDIVQGHLLAMEKGRAGQRYIFGTQYMSLGQLLEIFSKVSGQPMPPLKLPVPLAYTIAAIGDATAGKLRPLANRRFTLGAIRRLRSRKAADCTLAKEELGYRPSSIEEAVREAYTFFCNEGWIQPPAAVSETPSETPDAVQS